MTALHLSNQIMPRQDERERERKRGSERERERERHTAQSQIPLLVTEWVPSLSLSLHLSPPPLSPLPLIMPTASPLSPRECHGRLNKKWQLKHHRRLEAEWGGWGGLLGSPVPVTERWRERIWLRGCREIWYELFQWRGREDTLAAHQNS